MRIKRSMTSDRVFLIILVLFAIVSALFIICMCMHILYSEVINIYFTYADEVMGGRSPHMEYPPFALFLLMIPRLFTSDPNIYDVIFVAQAYVFFAVGLWTVRRLAAFYNKDQNQMMILYAAFLLLMIQFVLDRHDIFPLVITLVSLYVM